MGKHGETPSREAAKRPYEAPALTRRQTLTEVTAIMKPLSGEPEEKPGPCWVARAAYGEDNPRWVFFRAWLIEDAPSWLRRLYLRHGEAFARTVARRRWLQAGLRRMMDRAIAAKFSG